MSASTGAWNFYIDRGGTFTDVVAEAPDGALTTLKLLSDSSQYDDAALEGIRRALGVESGAAIPSARIGEVRMGTTVATNALLTRSGEPTVLITTRGFRDQLRIGYQNRPKLFTLRIDLPDMLYDGVIEADERVTAEGEVLRALDEGDLRQQLAAVRRRGIAACAIVFLHGFRFPAHEARAAELARAAGFTQISTSHACVPLMKFVSRGDTTVADAYLSPALARYTRRVAAELGKTRVFFMTSNGGLAAPEVFRGKDAIVSGPAGGVVGMAETARAAGFAHVIGFDMGGTSTDVARFDGTFERVYETEVAGVRLRTPMLALHTVAAGGGSILHYDGARFRVGPDSAGADPGPLSYGRGGPLTVTDANVMVGKLNGQYFPRLVGAKGDAPLDEIAVRAAFADLARTIGKAPEEVADGFIRIAVENMANAIRKISVAKGYDARSYSLNCFGGAGGQHACLVADALGMKTVFIHALSGLLSAYGMKLAALRTVKQGFIGTALPKANVALDEKVRGVRLRQRRADEALLHRAQRRELHAVSRQQSRQGMDEDRLHAERIGDETGMLPAGAAETVETVAARIIALGDRDFADRIGHVLDGNADEAIRDLLRRLADGAGEVGERCADRNLVKRRVAFCTEQAGKILAVQLSHHDIGVGDGERTAAAITQRTRIGAGGVRPDAKACAVIVQGRAAAGRHRVEREHRRSKPDAGDLGLIDAFE